MTQFNCFEPDQTRYELEELLGEGLNSRVYRALRVDQSGQSRQRVALKFLKDQTAVSFLRREFDTLLRVRSNYCARVIAWETQNGDAALALEWIDGLTLFDLVRTLVFNDALTDEVVRQIYLGLVDLRAAGLFHGDLHPKNIMIDRSGQVRLIDFSSGQTAEGFLQATPAFAAPEVWSDARFSFEADLFALGVVRQGLASSFFDLEVKVKEPLMDPDPHRRGFKLPRENLAARHTIATEVERRLANRNSLNTQLIAPLAKEPVSLSCPVKSFIRSAVALTLALFSAMTVPVMAEAPAEVSEASSKLMFTSEHWMQIEINGKAAGFAPLSVSQLRAGQHRVAWRTAAGAGELQINLRAGQVLRLTETSKGVLKVR